MNIINLDASRFTSKAAAHEAIAKALDFPMYYGKNLDALADCLSELPRDTTVILTGMEAAREALGDYADDILEVFCEISAKGGFLLVVSEEI